MVFLTKLDFENLQKVSP